MVGYGGHGVVGLWGPVESSGHGTVVSLGGCGAVGCELCGLAFVGSLGGGVRSIWW